MKNESTGIEWRKPDWDKWRQIPKAPLWKLVALSCGIEPDVSPLEKQGELLLLVLSGFRESPERREYRKRLQIAKAHLGKDGPLRPLTSIEPAENCLVSLAEFVGWAKALPTPFDMPNELGQVAAGM